MAKAVPLNQGNIYKMLLNTVNHSLENLITDVHFNINKIFRYIAFGLLVMGLGAFVFSLPHFLSDKLLTEKNTKNETAILCRNTNQTNIPSKDTSAMSNYFVFFIIAQILHGAGAAPILSLGKQL